MSIDKVSLKVGRAQFNKKLFPEKYTEDNKFGLYSPKEKENALATAFNRSSNIWLDFSPFEAGVKLEKPDVQAQGLAFLPKWYVSFQPEGSKEIINGTVFGNGTGVEENSVDGVWNIGGESADESLGYHIRFHVTGEGTYTVRCVLEAHGRYLEDSVTFRVS